MIMKMIYARIFIISVALLTACSSEKEIYIGGIFPMSGGWAGGQACHPSVELAIEDVNNNKTMLPGYKLVLEFKDSKCDAGIGIKKFFDLWRDKRVFAMLTGCSSVSTPIAESAYLWNINVIAFGASSPALSNRDRFKTFFRTHPSATIHNPTRIKLFKHFKWNKIAIINQDVEVFSSTADDLKQRLLAENMTVLTHQTFHAEPKVPVQNLEKEDARIIVGLFYEGMARKVMCQAFKEKLYGKKIVWFLLGWYKNGWYKNLKEKNINCSEENMEEVVQGHFTTEILMLGSSNDTISGMKPSSFKSRLNLALGKNPSDLGGYAETPLAYDALWALAIALNKTIIGMDDKDINRDNKELGNKMYIELNSSRFTGISGPVSFDADGSRMAWTRTERFMNATYLTVMEYLYTKDKAIWEMNVWKEGDQPTDQTLEIYEPYSRSQYTLIIECILTTASIISCLACLSLNVRYRNEKKTVGEMHMLNDVSLVGNILLLSSIFLFAVDIDPQYVCQVRSTALILGFTIAYSPMFVKLWTVNALHKTNILKKKKYLKQRQMDQDENSEVSGTAACSKHKRKSLRHQNSLADDSSNVHAPEAVKTKIDLALVVVMLFPLLFDVLLIILWNHLDRLTPETLYLDRQVSEDNEDKEIIPEIQICVSSHFFVWLGIVIFYKTIHLLLGSFLAYEGRSKVESDCDHQHVAAAIYCITALALFCVPVVILFREKPVLFHVFLSIPILISIVMCNVIIFLPKWREVRRGDHTVKEQMKLMIIHKKNSKKEEEEEKLRLHNKMLRGQIAEIDEKLNELKRRRNRRSSSSQHDKHIIDDDPSNV